MNIIAKLTNFKDYPRYINKVITLMFAPIEKLFISFFQRIIDKKDVRPVKSLLQIQNYDELANESRQKLLPYYKEYVSTISTDEHTLSLELAVLLLVICQTLKPKRIVDFGSGFSSFVFRYYMKNAVDKPVVWSVDDNSAWLVKTNAFLTKHGVSNENLTDWDSFIKQKHEKFDLVLNDFSLIEGRKKKLSDILSMVAPHKVLIMDDMHMRHFAKFVVKTLRNYNFKHYSLGSLTKDKFGRFSTLLID